MQHTDPKQDVETGKEAWQKPKLTEIPVEETQYLPGHGINAMMASMFMFTD